MKKSPIILIIIVLGVMYTAGCKKKDKGNPPVLPSYESMLIDFSNFISGSKSGASDASGIKGPNTGNWQFASDVATVWKTSIETVIEVPLASLKVTDNFEPAYLSENNWQWSYSFSAAGQQYKAKLTGEIRNVDIAWKMYITKEGSGGFTDFLWVYGVSATDASGGEWIVKQSNSSPDEVFKITWTTANSEVSTVQYEYTKADGFKGSTIKFGFASGALNSYYDIHYFASSLARFSDVDIEWSSTSKNGRVKSADYLLGTWYCWDANKVNTVCTN